MSDKLGRKIGEGGCSEVYEWEDGSKIIKLAKPNTSPVTLLDELHHCWTAWDCGLPVPRPFEPVKVNGRSGIVFERIHGKPVMNRFLDRAAELFMTRKPLDANEDFLDARLTARMLHLIHAQSVSYMPDQRQHIKNDIQHAHHLSADEKAAIIAGMDLLPLKQQLCHGDPNPNNILYRERDSVFIDWSNASTGNPEADLAEYIVMIRYAVLPPHLPREAAIVLDAVREDSVRMFMDEYERLSGLGYADVEPWLVIISARKLAADGICDEEKRLLVDDIRSKLKSAQAH